MTISEDLKTTEISISEFRIKKLADWIGLVQKNETTIFLVDKSYRKNRRFAALIPIEDYKFLKEAPDSAPQPSREILLSSGTFQSSFSDARRLVRSRNAAVLLMDRENQPKAAVISLEAYEFLKAAKKKVDDVKKNIAKSKLAREARAAASLGDYSSNPFGDPRNATPVEWQMAQTILKYGEYHFNRRIKPQDMAKEEFRNLSSIERIIARAMRAAPSRPDQPIVPRRRLKGHDVA